MLGYIIYDEQEIFYMQIRQKISVIESQIIVVNIKLTFLHMHYYFNFSTFQTNYLKVSVSQLTQPHNTGKIKSYNPHEV